VDECKSLPRCGENGEQRADDTLKTLGFVGFVRGVGVSVRAVEEGGVIGVGRRRQHRNEGVGDGDRDRGGGARQLAQAHRLEFIAEVGRAYGRHAGDGGGNGGGCGGCGGGGGGVNSLYDEPVRSGVGGG